MVRSGAPSLSRRTFATAAAGVLGGLSWRRYPPEHVSEWVYRTGGWNLPLLQADDESVYVWKRSSLFALDRESGERRWTIPAAELRIDWVPVVADDLLYAAADFDDGGVVAIDAETGAIRWASEETFGSPNRPIVNDQMVLGYHDGGLRALDAATGDERWISDVEAEFSHLIDAHDGMAVLRGEEHVYGFDLEDASTQWSHRIEWGVEDVAIVDGIACVESGDGILYGLGLHSGEERWRVLTDPGSPPGVKQMGDTVVYGELDATIVLKTSSGNERWRAQGSYAGGIADGILAVKDGSRVRGLDLRTGAEQWVFEELPEVKQFDLESEMLYVVDGADRIHAVPVPP